MERFALIVTALTLAAVAAAGAVRVGRRRTRSKPAGDIIQQHIDLFQGGRLSDSAVRIARLTFEQMLERGESGCIEATLRPGLEFAVNVRALAEIGAPGAGDILERQLQRRIGSDPLEQSWYLLDLAHGLRLLDRGECLPALLRRASAEGLPLAHLLAAEIVCFSGFVRALRRPESAHGRCALRVLHQALVGLRCGVQPQVVVMARLGEAVETVWERRHDDTDPMLVRIFAEALRLQRRAEHAERSFSDDAERDTFRTEMALLRELAEPMAEYLDDARVALLGSLAAAPRERQADWLRALTDLRADTAAAVLPLLDAQGLACPALAVESLAWSGDDRVGPWLCEWTLGSGRKTQTACYLAVLKTLRHFPSEDAERVLIKAMADRSATVRAAALGSLGWWEPVSRATAVAAMRTARRDRNADVRRAAEAAFARLGERLALQWFRLQFAGENSDPIHHAIQATADEGLMLLWPDLDRLADADDCDVAYHACEALEQLRESLSVSGSLR
jgi:hypothetical protein